MAIDQNFLTGFLGSFGQQLQNNRERAEREEMKKLQIKMFKKDLEDKEKQEAALKQVFDAMKGIENLPADFTGPPRQTEKKSILDILADPQGQSLAMQSGMVTAKDLIGMNNKSSGLDLSKIPPGMVLSGVKIAPDGSPMYDFTLPKADKEVKDKTGKNVISLDAFGNPISSRPAAPEEISLTPAQKAIDTKFAEEYTQFQTAGGFADVKKGLSQLNEAVKALSKSKTLTGPIIGNAPDFALQILNPNALSVMEGVQEVAQRNLKLVLGAQFTEKEGDKLIARAFNPSLDEKENLKRVRRLVSQIQAAANSKADAIRYYEQNGTLAGWKGKLYDISDFENIDYGDGAGGNVTLTPDDEALVNKYLPK